MFAHQKVLSALAPAAACTWWLHHPAGGGAEEEKSITAVARHGYRKTQKPQQVVEIELDHCVVVALCRVEGTVVSLLRQLVLIWAWFSGICTDCWPCIMHESVHMYLGHHACPCRNVSTNRAITFGLFLSSLRAQTPVEVSTHFRRSRMYPSWIFMLETIH